MSTSSAHPRSRRASTSHSCERAGRRDLPKDRTARSPAPLSAKKEKWSRRALGGSNICNKTVGTVAVGGQMVGFAAGRIVGLALTGPAAKGAEGIYSTKPERDRYLYSNVVRRTSAIGGALVGGPILIAGGLANAVVASPLHVGAYAGKKYLDKHDLERPAWSFKPKDKTLIRPGESNFEPRLPIIQSRVWDSVQERPIGE